MEGSKISLIARHEPVLRVGFGPFFLDVSAGVLFRGDDPVDLPPKLFNLLASLVGRSGKVVAKEELLDAVWNGTAVTDHSLTEAISALRGALGDDPRDPSYIQTVHRRGYRFIAPVSPVGATSNDAALRLAIMPFVDLSRKGDQQYFCNGIVEELVATLTGLPGIHLPSPASIFAIAANASPLEVAGRIDASAVLEGTVRKSGSKLSVSVRLTDVRNGAVLKSFKCVGDVDQALAIQEDLSARVVRVLDLSDDRSGGLIRNHSADATAYDLYLMSRHHWNSRTLDGLRKAIALGEQAVRRDPEYGQAHVTLALASAVLASYSAEPPRPLADRARAAATRALEIDESLAEAHSALGLVCFAFDRNWDEAERAFSRALELAPRDATTHCWLGFWHLVTGDGEQALRSTRHAEELEPTSLIFRTQVSWVLYFLRRFDEALERLDDVLHQDRSFWRAYLNAAWCHMQLGEFDEAVTAIETAVALNDYPLVRAVQVNAYAAAGRPEEARALLESLLAGESFVSPYCVALAYLALDDKPAALEWLERSLEHHEWISVFARYDPWLDPIRDTAAFRRFMRRRNL